MLQLRNLTRPGLDVSKLIIADGECVAVTGPSGVREIFITARYCRSRPESR